MNRTEHPRQQLRTGARRHLPLTQNTALSDPAALAGRIAVAARRLGFVRIGFARAEPFTEARGRLEDWLDRGCHGEMAYLAKSGDRSDPRAALREARTLIAVALPCPPASRGETGSLSGVIARYAHGDDYHLVIRQLLQQLADACAEIAGRPVLARPCVDTAPLLEREAAARAGLGFIGKSTLLIAPGLGSHLLLGELLTDLEIAPSTRIGGASGCGTCTACLDACPTGAFVGPYMLDARRCISYLTIELVGAIPRALRPLLGRRVFGCDTCQDVCPFNTGPDRRERAEPTARSELDFPDLIELLALGSAAHRRLVRGTALRRVSRARLARNAAVALGNSADRRAVKPLCRALAADASPLVRAHAAWALGRLGGPAARAALQAAVAADRDPEVVTEAELALAELDSSATVT